MKSSAPTRPVRPDKVPENGLQYIEALESYIDDLLGISKVDQKLSADIFGVPGIRQTIFNSFSHQISSGVFVTNGQGKLMYWNRALEQILGDPKKTPDAWQFQQFLHIDINEDDIVDGLASFIYRYKDTPLVTEQWLIVQKEIKCIRSTLFPICFDRLIVVGGIVEDISEQKVHESESQRYLSMLEKQVEVRTKRLTDAQMQLQILNNNIPNGFLFRKIRMDDQTRFSYIGSNVEKIIGMSLGLTSEDVASFYEHIHPDDRTQVIEKIENAASCSMDVRVQYRFFNNRNEIVWLEESAISHPGPNESIITDGYVIDVTSRKNSEKSLFVHLERQKTISNVLHELHNSEDIQASLYHVLEWIGLHFNAFYAQMVLTDHNPPKTISWASPKTAGDEYPLIEFDEKLTSDLFGLKDYQIIEYPKGYLIAYPIVGKEKDYGLFLYFRPLEMRRWTAEETDLLSNISQIAAHALDLHYSFTTIHDSYERFNTVLDNLEPYIYVTDIDTYELLFVNKTVRDIKGELDGQMCWKAIRGKESQSCEDCKVRELLEGKSSKVSFKYFDKRLNKHFEKTSSIIPWVDGRKAHLSVLYDITPQVKTFEELQAAKEKAEEADKLKTVFLANMSHEIRTPMNGIIGFASLLEQEEQDPHLYTYIEQITENSNILLKLIEDILDISQIEANMVKVWDEECKLNIFFKELYTLFLPILEKKGKTHINLILDLPQEDVSLTFDFIRLRQILSNLIENAIKFTEEGHINIGYRLQQDGYLMSFVEDTGIGIPEEKIGVIFERFRQVEESGLARNYGGSGLGLPIAKGLVERLGGKIEVISENGKGSTFKVYIPVTLPKEEKSNEVSPISKQNILSKYANKWAEKKVLIAEDELTNYMLLKKMMDPLGIEVYRACDGMEALEMVQTIPNISIVLMDIKMPRMDGIAATRTIKQQQPGIPVVAQTAYAMPEDIENGKKAGFDAYLTKPITISALIDVFTTYLPEREMDAVVETV